MAHLLLKYHGEFAPGVLLEVGGAHPEAISNSFPLRGMGWNVISVEPIPEFIKEYKKLGLPVLEYAAAGENLGATTFQVSPDLVCSSALAVSKESAAVSNQAFGWTENSFKTITVEALTLDAILARHHPEITHIDILVIDTEGWELEVVKGINLKFYKPDLIVLENSYGYASYNKYMEDNGYKFVHQRSQDHFFVRA